MYRIAVIGDEDSICGFSAVGIKAIPVKDADEAYAKLTEISDADYGVVFVTENVYSRINEDFPKDLVFPAVIPIPGNSGNTGIGMQNVSKFVEKAVGSDIIS